jgi:hypothetical protein
MLSMIANYNICLALIDSQEGQVGKKKKLERIPKILGN